MPLVAWDTKGVLAAPPSTQVQVGLTVAGADANVQVYLDGDYGDAWLGAGSVKTVSGHAEVLLQTSSQVSTFSLKARLGAVEATLDVAVSRAGFTDVSVTPTYLGHRTIAGLTGSVFARAACADLAKQPIADGAPVVRAEPGAQLTLPSVPAGAPVAIALRAGHFARGCVDVTDLVPGTPKALKVPIYDVPMALDGAVLVTTHTFAPSTAVASSFSSYLAAVSAHANDAFLAPSGTEAGALLDAMAAAAPPGESTAFASSRGQGYWDQKAQTWLDAHAPSMRARAAAWLATGQAEASRPIVGHLSSLAAPGKGALALDSWGDLSALLAGAASVGPFDWTADPDDTVHLAGDVAFYPSALLSAAADLAAAQDVPGAVGVAGALDAKIDCAGLAAGLVGQGTSYPSCDFSCTALLCRSALVAMWGNASAASAAQNDKLTIGIATSAHATVDDVAAPTGFTGTWSGAITTAVGGSYQMQGDATATK